MNHKIDIICPSSLYNKPILPDCEANIARLPLFAQQTGMGAFWLFGFLISHSSPGLCWTFARLFDFVIFGGGAAGGGTPMSLTIYWCQCKGSSFPSIILRPWVEVQGLNPGLPVWKASLVTTTPRVLVNFSLYIYFTCMVWWLPWMSASFALSRMTDTDCRYGLESVKKILTNK
jgi:hypothetical protein